MFLRKEKKEVGPGVEKVFPQGLGTPLSGEELKQTA